MEDQFSLAIGRGGQNSRLAAKLTGFKIDIKIVDAEGNEVIREEKKEVIKSVEVLEKEEKESVEKSETETELPVEVDSKEESRNGSDGEVVEESVSENEKETNESLVNEESKKED
jgi:N utilization substance protein A